MMMMMMMMPWRSMGKAERKVEDYLIEQVLLHGGLCEKHISPGRNKVPDELVTWNGFMDLVETKAKNGEVDEGQARDHKRRLQRGILVWVLHTKEAVDEYIRQRKHGWL
jgi:hypothetical protein